MALKSGFGAKAGRRPRTPEQPSPRSNFPPAGAVCDCTAETNSREKHIAHSRYEFPCAGLRAHAKETLRRDSKRNDRATTGIITRVDPERFVPMCGRSFEQPEIGRATRRCVFPGQNNVPFCSEENAWANQSKDSYRFDDRLAFLAAMGGAAFALGL